MRLVQCVMALVIALSPAALYAQQPTPVVQPGSAIRITAPSVGLRFRAKAVVDSASPGLLFVRNITEPPELRDLPQLTIPLHAITHLDVRTGRRSRNRAIGTGALIGLAAGVLIPVGYALTPGALDETDSWGWGGVALSIATIVPWTSAVGATVGALLPVDRWQRVIPAAVDRSR